MEILRRRVCDECGSDDDVQRVKITLVGEKQKTATVDLCKEHVGPVLGAMNVKGNGKRRVASRKEVEAARRKRR